MDYLPLANVQQSKSESAPQITTQMILMNRLNYFTAPIVKLIGLPYSILLRFGAAIADEGRRDLESQLKTEALNLKKLEVKAVAIEQLKQRAQEPILTPRQVINRQNAKAPRKGKKQA